MFLSTVFFSLRSSGVLGGLWATVLLTCCIRRAQNVEFEHEMLGISFAIGDASIGNGSHLLSPKL